MSLVCVQIFFHLALFCTVDSFSLLSLLYTELFEMIVGVVTTCHTQYTGDKSMQLHRWI